MTMTVSVQDAKTQLSKLLNDALNGEEVVISRRGVPTVRLTPIQDTAGRVFDFLPGGLSEASVAESIAPLDDEELRHWGMV